MTEKTEETKDASEVKHPFDEVLRAHGNELIIKLKVEDLIEARNLLDYLKKDGGLLVGCRVMAIGMGGLIRNGLDVRRKQILEQVDQLCRLVEHEVMGERLKDKTDTKKDSPEEE